MHRSPRRWTSQEDAILLEKTKQQLESGTGISWGNVSDAIPSRNNKDCRKRWYKLTGTKKGFGRQARMNDSLKACKNMGVNGYGLRKWWVQEPGIQIVECAKRWQQCLDPSLDRSEWTHEMDIQLISAVTNYGTNWKAIREFEFPNRSTTNLKNRHIALLRQSNKNSEARSEPLELDCSQHIFDNMAISDEPPLFQNTLDCNPTGFDQSPLDWEYPFSMDFTPFETLPGYDTNIEPTFSENRMENELFLSDIPMGSPSHRETNEHREIKEVSLGVPQTILVMEDPDPQTMTSILEVLVKAKIKVTVSSTET